MATPKRLVAIANVSSTQTTHINTQKNLEPIPHSTGAFASGEPFSELFPGQQEFFRQNSEKLNACEALVLHSPELENAEQREQLHLLVRDFKDYGADEVTVCLPCAPFERQDKGEKERFVSKGLPLFLDHLKASGADRVIRITPHSQAAVAAYKKVFGDNFITLSATKLFADHIRASHKNLEEIRIGAPDGADKKEDEGQRRAFELARELFGDKPTEELKKHMFFITKRHDGFDENGASKTIIEGKIEGDIAGKHCIIIDDMIDGGSTMMKASKGLKESGAVSVEGMATHGILTGQALQKILSPSKDKDSAPLDKLTLTDSLPSLEHKLLKLRSQQPELAEKVSILSVGPMIAQTLATLPPLVKSIGRSGR